MGGRTEGCETRINKGESLAGSGASFSGLSCPGRALVLG